MANLSGKKVKDTYQGLIKTVDNEAADAANRELTDGAGNDLNISVNTGGDLTAVRLIKSSGTSSQFLMADGSVLTLTTESAGISSNDTDTNIPTNAAVKDYVDDEITDLIGGAPAALDTLNELAAALGDDANLSSTFTAALAKRLAVDSSQSFTEGEITQALSNLGITATKAELNILDGVTATATELNKLDGLTSSTAELNILDGVTATSSELNILDGVTATSAELNILDGVTATATELNKLDGVTASTAELNYTDGVTSNIQTQLNSKQATITGAATTIDDADLTSSRAVISNASGKIAISDVTSAEIGHLDGVTSGIQTQLDGKQATITGAATTVTSANLTTSRAVISNASGKLSVSDVTSTEIGYLDGVTSNIQTQLDAKTSDQTVVLTDSYGINTSGTYPTFTIESNGTTNQNGGASEIKYWTGTQSAYDALSSYDSGTVYFVT